MDRDPVDNVRLTSWLAEHARPGAAVGYVTPDQPSWLVPGGGQVTPCTDPLSLGWQRLVGDGLLVIADPPRDAADLVRALLDGARPRRDGAVFAHDTVSAVATTCTDGDTPATLLARLYDSLVTGATVTDPPGMRRVAVGVVGDMAPDGTLTVVPVQVPIDAHTDLYQPDAATRARDVAAWLDAVRGGPSQCVAVVDIDRLALVNHRFGIVVGDQMVAATAMAVARTVPAAASIRRTGGEEWLVAWDGDDVMRARAALEEVGAAVAASGAMRTAGVTAGSGTVTAGLTIRRAGMDAHTAIEAVLDACAAGARAGGGRVVEAL